MRHLSVAGKLHPAALDLLHAAPATHVYVEDIPKPSCRAHRPRADALPFHLPRADRAMVQTMPDFRAAKPDRALIVNMAAPSGVKGPAT